MNPQYHSSSGMKVPVEYCSENFNPVVVSLNNKTNFFAVMPSTMKNNNSRNRCELYLTCEILLGEKTMIGTVYVLDGQDHPKAGRQAVVCAHHADASNKGVRLQIQKTVREASTRNMGKKQQRR